MSKESKYRPILQRFKGLSSFTTSEALSAGMTRRALAYFVERGELECICRGHYRLEPIDSGDLLVEDLALVASTIPNSVICLISALSYYELTDEIPRQYWIAVPRSQWAAKRPHARTVRMQDVITGVAKLTMAGIEVRIFDRERCIVDAFRYLEEEVAIKALREYLLNTGFRPDIPKLLTYASILRVDISSYIKAFSV